MSQFTSHAEYGNIKTLYLKKAEYSFRSQDLLDNQWKMLNYYDVPIYKKAINEYQAFEALLKNRDAKISYFSTNDLVTIDSIYCRDASIATDFGMILCNMGKGPRKPEPSVIENDYHKEGIKILGQINGQAKLEGGDVAWIALDTLAVGRGYRSNDEGFIQLKNLLQDFHIKVIQVDLPHYKGQEDVFHLMSIFSPIGKKLAVIYSPLMPVRFREELVNRGYEFVEVPNEEFDTMACNVLSIGEKECIVLKGNPITKGRLEKAGIQVLEYEGKEISVKGEGGPTCLTRPIIREIE
jgi:N-dimethylarginine dimethylaminohydrolase